MAGRVRSAPRSAGGLPQAFEVGLGCAGRALQHVQVALELSGEIHALPELLRRRARDARDAQSRQRRNAAPERLPHERQDVSAHLTRA